MRESSAYEAAVEVRDAIQSLRDAVQALADPRLTVARMAAALEAGDRASGEGYSTDEAPYPADFYARRAWALYTAVSTADPRTST